MKSREEEEHSGPAGEQSASGVEGLTGVLMCSPIGQRNWKASSLKRITCRNLMFSEPFLGFFGRRAWEGFY